MDSKYGQKFQWTFGAKSIPADPPRPNNVTAATPPSTTSSVSSWKDSKSSSPAHKPYSSSTLWNLKEAENPVKCFLTLTPQANKPLTTSLPLISFAPRKRAKDSSETMKSVYSLANTPDSEQHPAPKMKYLSPGADIPDVSIPSIPGRFRDNHHHQQQNHHHRLLSRPRMETSVPVDIHQNEAQNKSKVPKLPSLNNKNNNNSNNKERVSPRSDLSFHPSSVFSSPRSHAAAGLRLGQQTSGSPRAGGGHSRETNVWTNPELSSHHHPSWPVSVTEQNELDSGNLYSKRQSAFYSRIAREHTVVPLPSKCNRFLGDDAQANAEYANERRYVIDNYLEKQSHAQRLARDQVVFPSVYKSHMKNGENKRSYVKSMLASEEKLAQFAQMSCSRCNQIFQMEMRNEYNGNDWIDENNNVEFLIETERKLRQSPSPGQRRDKLRKKSRSEQDKQDTRENNNVGGLTPRAREKKKEAKGQSAVFCDVLGKRTCQKCREFYSRRYQRRVEETLNEENGFKTRTPPSTPDEVSLPTQALHKVVIRVKDKQGVMAVTAVGVNEDAVTGR